MFTVSLTETQARRLASADPTARQEVFANLEKAAKAWLDQQQDQRRATAELAALLDSMWTKAGCPQLRGLATKMLRSHTAVGTALRCQPVPTWDLMHDLVKALGGDPEQVKPVWQRAKGPDRRRVDRMLRTRVEV